MSQGQLLEESSKWQRFSDRTKATVNRLFPERQIMVRTEGRLRYIRVTKALQISAVSALLAVTSWVTYSTASYVLNERVLAIKDAEINKARLAYDGLLGEVGNYQDKFSSLTTELVENHGLMLKLVEQNATLQQSLKSVATKLETTQEERETVIATRERLKSELKVVESKMSNLASRNYSLDKELNNIETSLRSVDQERRLALEEKSRLGNKVKSLETTLSDLHESEKSSVQRMSDHTAQRIAAIEDVIARAGLDPVKLGSGEKKSGMGGPFIAANGEEGDAPQDKLKASLSGLESQVERWRSLKSLMNSLPLHSPLDYYYVTSSYGKRKDPVNNRWSHHYGLDMGSSYRAPVYTASAGTVTYAGWKGKYGKLIEIDHGNGVVSKYGHLSKIFIKKGDKVDHRTKIGLVGSTGRSTGAHLHYEITVNGKTKNPTKFIKAGRYVFKG